MKRNSNTLPFRNVKNIARIAQGHGHLSGCSVHLKEDRILSLHDSNKCFLKLKGGWSVEGKDGFWYFLSKPQQMIARKASYPSAPTLLLIIMITTTTTINHIDKIIIAINYVFIIHRHLHHYHHYECHQAGRSNAMGRYMSYIFWVS